MFGLIALASAAAVATPTQFNLRCEGVFNDGEKITRVMAFDLERGVAWIVGAKHTMDIRVTPSKIEVLSDPEIREEISRQDGRWIELSTAFTLRGSCRREDQFTPIPPTLF